MTTKTGKCMKCGLDIQDDEIAIVQHGYEHEPVHARCEDGLGETEAEYVERMARAEEEEETEAGFYRIGCTAHYTPVANGPFETEEECSEFATMNRLDLGVHNPPPFSVEYFDSLEEAKIAAEALAVGYQSAE